MILYWSSYAGREVIPTGSSPKIRYLTRYSIEPMHIKAIAHDTSYSVESAGRVFGTTHTSISALVIPHAHRNVLEKTLIVKNPRRRAINVLTGAHILSYSTDRSKSTARSIPHTNGIDPPPCLARFESHLGTRSLLHRWA